jgi:hypothetical protein
VIAVLSQGAGGHFFFACWNRLIVPTILSAPVFDGITVLILVKVNKKHLLLLLSFAAYGIMPVI